MLGVPICIGSPEEGEECGEFRVYRAWAEVGRALGLNHGLKQYGEGLKLHSRKISRWHVEGPDGHLEGGRLPSLVLVHRPWRRPQWP